MTESNILELRGIRKNFGGIQALKGVDFELRLGEIHALLGENGAGKSTLIKIMTGVHQADGGTILLNGTAVTIQSPIEARKKGIGAIYQELSLIDSLTAAENIFLGNEPVKRLFGICDKASLYEMSTKYLEEFGIGIDCRIKVSELGMGQKRILEIIKALAINSKILLLDEPTTGMSKSEIDTLFRIMERLKEKKVTMIYISHYLDEVFRICNRATVFRDGAAIGTYEMGKVTQSKLISAMIGRVIQTSQKQKRTDLSDKEVVLELDNYKTNKMKEAISLKVSESEILGITGIVGSGKSELAHSIFGHAKWQSGTMIIYGKKVRLKSPWDARKYQMAFIPEDRKTQGLFLKDTVANNMIMAYVDRFGKKSGFLDDRKKNLQCKEMAEKLRLSPMRIDIQAGNLSGGNQQKVVIGKWLIGNPNLVLMDEPTRGIDIGAKEEVYNLIRSLAESGKSVLVMSSEFNELLDLCDRIIVLYKGRIAGEVMPPDVSNETLLSLSLGG